MNNKLYEQNNKLIFLFKIKEFITLPSILRNIMSEQNAEEVHMIRSFGAKVRKANLEPTAIEKVKRTRVCNVTGTGGIGIAILADKA